MYDPGVHRYAGTMVDYEQTVRLSWKGHAMFDPARPYTSPLFNCNFIFMGRVGGGFGDKSTQAETKSGRA